MQEKINKQETLEEFINSQPYYGSCTTEYLEGIEEGAKWQQEKMYSVEDLKEAFYQGSTNSSGLEWGKNRFNEWLEQFKKK